MKALVNLNGHSIEIYASIWNGKEAVSYDGESVSSRRNLRTLTSFHSFTVQEDGEEIVYEVQISGGFGLGYVIRRNGIISAHKP